MKIARVIEELVEEKSLDYSVLSNIVCEGLLAAYQKKYPLVVLSVLHDKKNDEINIFAEKKVVAHVTDGFSEITLRKARLISSECNLGDAIVVPFDEPIGRIEIIKAKQVIAQKIRDIELLAVYQEFKPKEGSLVVGSVHKVERYGVNVKIGDMLAFLPKAFMIPGDKCITGYTIRALLKEVLLEPKNDNQLILDRSSVDFLEKLFELEIPEIYEKLVVIKKIVRIAGYKAKILVISRDKNIDPVGTCIGFGGARIKPILRELNVEKIDVISGEYDTMESLVAAALTPAVIKQVDIHGKEARVTVSHDQRALAIGKFGQNIRLASDLVDMQITINQPLGEDETAPAVEDDMTWDI